ncbi:hypothetical protein [Pedobacter paludis]|uniref:Uncharacterized protein n=1 Tax=Pedobacter paludis TaxID=2203212 RepID=A0A317F6J2_9SPHI|nr:hypothetical protein [Pedobacter paludis]PWS33166.1 hypothetical protein DF947_00575 [Pedobacter paludis]
MSEMPGIVLYGPGRYTPPVNAPVVDREFSRKIANFFRQLAGSVSSTYEGAIAMDIQIKQFIIDNPRVKDYLKAAGIALIIATIAEDFATSGAGIADDWACYVIARNMWILSNATTVGAIANM